MRTAIVGGGAGGLELAIKLARLTRAGGRARVTLVDERATHLWKPRLHEVAAGLLVAAEEETSYAAQARRHGFDFLLGRVDGLEIDRRELVIAPTAYPTDDPVAQEAGDDLLPGRTLAYDVAVLALGSTVNDFGVPGVREHCYTLDTPSGAERLHRALLARAARVEAGVQHTVRVVIVGAGTTGVELAAELRSAARRLSQYRSLLRPDQLCVTLMERADRALPASPKGVSAYARDMLASHDVELRFGAKVVRVAADGVSVEGGATTPADLIVWASGVKAKQFERPLNGAVSGKDGQIEVDAKLRVRRAEGGVFEELYAMGDCAAAPSGGGLTPATAQAAHQQAGLLARSLSRQTRGREALTFRYRYKGALVSLGGASAVGDVPIPSGGGLRVSGLSAKLLTPDFTKPTSASCSEFGGPRLWPSVALCVARPNRRSNCIGSAVTEDYTTQRHRLI